jgi:hypothetical protein
MKAFLSLFASALLIGCTGPINSQTVVDKPTAYLCRILSDDYLSLPSEQEAIYRELERRGEECIPTSRIIVE